jgi:hypothetical protein
MTTTSSASNGRRRPTLSDQIDRLDSTLDGLADGLNEAVADAVRVAVGAAVREAVHATLTEVFTNPEILARLRDATTPPREASPQTVHAKPVSQERLAWLWRRVREGLTGLRENARSGLCRVGGWLAGLRRGITSGCAALWGRCRSLAPFRYELLTALSVGATAGALAFWAGPHLAALLSGVGGFAATVTVHGWLWLRRSLGLPVEQVA